MANVNAIIENLGSGADATAKTASATSLDGIDDSELYNYATPVATTTITRWMKVASLTEEILIINEGEVDEANIVLTAGSFVGTGFSSFSATVLQGSIAANKWFEVQFTFTSIDIDTIEWGTDGTGFGEVDLAEWSTNALNYPTISGAERCLPDTSANEEHGTLVGGLTWLNGLSGKENGETHNGLPQLYGRNYNKTFALNTGSSRLSLGPIAWPINNNQSFILSFFWPNHTIVNDQDNSSFFNIRDTTGFAPFNPRYSLYVTATGIRLRHMADTGGSGTYATKTLHFTGAIIRQNSFNTVKIRVTGSSFAEVIIILNGTTLTPNATLDTGEDPSLWDPYYSFWSTQIRYFRNTGASQPFGIIIHSARIYSDNNFTTLSNEWLATNKYAETGGGATLTPILPVRINLPAKSSDSTTDVFNEDITESINVSANKRYFNMLSAVGSDDRTITYANITGSFQLNNPLNFSEGAIFLIVRGRNQNRNPSAGGILIEGRDGPNDGFAIQQNASDEYQVLYNAQDYDAIGSVPTGVHLLTVWFTDTQIIVRTNGVQLGATSKTGGTIAVTSNGKLLEDYLGNKNFEGQIGRFRVFDQPATLSIIEATETDIMNNYGL